MYEGSKVISENLQEISYTVLPNTLSGVNIKRSISSIGVSSFETRDFWIEINLQITSPMVKSDLVDVAIPYDQLVIFNTREPFKCQKLNKANVREEMSCNLIQGLSTDYFHVYFQPCIDPQYTKGEVCPSQTQFKFFIYSGIQNKEWILDEYTNFVLISTVTSDLKYIIDSEDSDVELVPKLEPTKPQVLEISKAPNGKVYEQTVIDINLQLGSTIPPLGFFLFTFPQKFLFLNKYERPLCYVIEAKHLSDLSYTNNETQIDCNTKSFSEDPALYGIKELKFTNMCFKDANFERSICTKGKQYYLRVTNVINPQSVKEFSKDLRINYNSYTEAKYQIDIGDIGIEQIEGLSVSQETWQKGSIKLLSPKDGEIVTGAVEQYNFSIILPTGLKSTQRAKETLTISFPKEIIIKNSGNAKCTAVIKSKYLRCDVNIELQAMQIYHSFNLDTFDNETLIATLIEGAYNPGTTAASSSFMFKTELYDKSTLLSYLVRESSENICVKPNKPNQLSEIKIQRNEPEIKKSTDLQIQFQTINKVSIGSRVDIQIPKDQVIIQNLKINDGNKEIKIIEQTEDVNFYHLKLLEWCSLNNQDCTKGSIMNLTLKGLRNPDSTKPPSNSFQIMLSTKDGFFSDKSYGLLLSTPDLSPSPLQQFDLTQSTSSIGVSTILGISLTPQNTVSQGIIILEFSQAIFQLKSDELKCTGCTIIDYKVENESKRSSPYGTGITQIKVQTNGLQQGKKVQMEIQGLYNRYNTQDLEVIGVKVTVKTLDLQGYDLDSSQATVGDGISLIAKLNPNPFAKVLSVKSDKNIVNQGTEVTIELVTVTPFPASHDSRIDVFLPFSHFNMNGSASCSFPCTIQQKNTSHLVLSFSAECSSEYCLENQNHNIKVIKGLKNRYSTQIKEDELEIFGMESLTKQQGVFSVLDDCTAGGNFQPSSWSLQLPDKDSVMMSSGIQYSSAVVGEEPVSIQIQVQLDGFVKIGDQIQIFFEDNGDFKGLFRQSSYLDCKINGLSSLGCAISSYDNLKYPTVEYLLLTVPQDIQGSISLNISNIGNPLDSRPITQGAKIRVQIFKQNQVNNKIAQGTFTYASDTQLISQAASIKNALVKRSDKKFDTDIEVSIKFQVLSQIEPKSKMVIKIAQTQFLQSERSMSCKFQNKAVDCYVDLSKDRSYFNLYTDFNLPYFEQNVYYEFIITNGLKNPSSVDPNTKPIYVQIFQQQYKVIDSSDINLYGYPPLIVRQFKNVKMSQTGSLVTGELTSFKFDLELDGSLIAQNYVVIMFGGKDFIRQSEEPMKVMIGDTLLKSQILQVDEFGSIKTIKITNICGDQECSIASFEIKNVRNALFQKGSQKQKFSFEAFTNADFSINKILIEDPLPDLTPSIISDLVIQRESNQIQERGVIYSFAFTTPNELRINEAEGEQVFLSLQVPKNEATQNAEMSCQFVGYSQYDLQDCTVNDDKEQFFTIQMTLDDGKSSNLQQIIYPSGTEMKFRIKLDNPNYVETSSTLFDLKIFQQFSSQNYLSFQFNDVIKVTPSLEGRDFFFTLQRLNGAIYGELDQIRIIVPEQRHETIGLETFMKVTFPEIGDFLQPRSEIICQVSRYENSEKFEKMCEYEYYENQVYGMKKVKTVKILDICSGNAGDLCEYKMPLILDFPIRNSYTNDLKYDKKYVELKFQSINQIGKIYDLAIGKLTIEEMFKTQKLQENDLLMQIEKIPEQKCYFTSTECQIAINLITKIPIQKDLGFIQVIFFEQMSILQNQKCIVEQKGFQCVIISPFILQIKSNGAEDLSLKVLVKILNPSSTEKFQIYGSSGIQVTQFENITGVGLNPVAKLDGDQSQKLEGSIAIFEVAASDLAILKISGSSSGNKQFSENVDGVKLSIQESRINYKLDPEVVVQIPESQGSIDWLDKTSFQIFYDRAKSPLEASKLNESAFSIDLLNWPQEKPLNLLLPFSKDYIMYRGPSFLVPKTSPQFSKVLVTIKPKSSDSISFQSSTDIKGYDTVIPKYLELSDLESPFKFNVAGEIDSKLIKIKVQGYVRNVLYEIKVQINGQPAFIRKIVDHELQANLRTISEIIVECLTCKGKSQISIEVLNTGQNAQTEVQIFEIKKFPDGYVSLSNIVLGQQSSQVKVIERPQFFYDNQTMLVLFYLPEFMEPAEKQVQINMNVRGQIKSCKKLNQEQNLDCRIQENKIFVNYGFEDYFFGGRIELENAEIANFIDSITIENEAQTSSQVPMHLFSGSIDFCEDHSTCFRCPPGCKVCHTHQSCDFCDQNGFIWNGMCGTGQCPIIDGGQAYLNELTQCAIQQYDDCLESSPDSLRCLKCKEGVSYNGKCLEECPLRYFEVLGQCFSCNPSCEKCEGTANNCSTCRNDLIFDETKSFCYDECSEGAVKSQNDPNRCIKCSENCATCSDYPDQCTRCTYNQTSMLDQFLLDQECVEICPYGSLTNITSHECVAHPLLEDDESEELAPILLIVSPLLFATLLSIASQKSILDMILGAYGSLEIAVRIFGVLAQTQRKRELFNQGGDPLMPNDEGSWITEMLWGRGTYLTMNKGEMTVFAVNLALVYVSFIITSWYLQKYVKVLIEKGKPLLLISLFACHIFGFNSHFFLVHISSLYWRHSVEQPIPAKSSLAFLSNLQYFLWLNQIFYTIPTIVVCSYSLVLEYGAFKDIQKKKILTFAIFHDDSYCLTLLVISLIIVIITVIKSIEIRKKTQDMIKLREKQD